MKFSPVQPVDPAGNPIPANRAFVYPPLSPQEATRRPNRPVTRGRPPARSSVHERWLTRRHTGSGARRPRLNRVTEDLSLETTQSLDNLLSPPPADPNPAPPQDPTFVGASQESLIWDTSDLSPTYFSTPLPTATSSSVTVAHANWPTPPPAIPADAGQAAMPPAADEGGQPPPHRVRELDEILHKLRRSILTYEDDIQDLQPDDYDTAVLEVYLQHASDAKLVIQDASGRLEDVADPRAAAIKDRAAAAKRGLVAFIRNAQKCLAVRRKEAEVIQLAQQAREHELQVARQAREREEALAQQATAEAARAQADATVEATRRANDTNIVVDKEVRGATIKEKRVNTKINPLIIEMQNLVIELDAAGMIQPTTNANYRSHLERMDSLTFRAKSLKLDSKQLVEDAMDLKMDHMVVELDTICDSLKTSERDAVTNLQDLKDRFGPMKTGNSADVPVPVFSGTAGLDYYTFYKEWEDYSDTRHMSKSELLRVLTQKAPPRPLPRGPPTSPRSWRGWNFTMEM